MADILFGHPARLCQDFLDLGGGYGDRPCGRGMYVVAGEDSDAVDDNRDVGLKRSDHIPAPARRLSPAERGEVEVGQETVIFDSETTPK